MSWDVIVVGLGAMGSAVAGELARRGRRVLGLDQFRPPHALGSSHGETRIIREAYFEHALYVPLVQRAYEGWADLERATGNRLLISTGGLMIGPPEGELVSGALGSARLHGLPHEVLSADEVLRRYPALNPRPHWVAVLEPRAGVLFPERGIAAQLQVAEQHGAELRLSTPVWSWQRDGDGVAVTTAAGTMRAGTLVVAAGPWAASLVSELSPMLTVERQVLHWFRPHAHGQAFAADRLPIFLLEHEPGRMLYGVPELPEVGVGVKVACHHDGETTTADAIQREVSTSEVEAMTPLLTELLPDLAGGWDRSSVCMSTNTPDQHFLIDWHPSCDHVLLVSPCSGHGFKFSPVVGEIAADPVISRSASFDLTPFRFRRPGA